jgi:predicted branched-subunit amino acid permease
MSSPRSEFLSGLKAELPIALSVIPFGMIYGVLALDAGLPDSATQAMSAIIFAGSSQFISTQLFSQSAPGLIIVISVGVVNLRHLLYSASIAPYVQRLPVLWKMLLAYLLTDEAYAVSITR